MPICACKNLSNSGRESDWFCPPSFSIFSIDLTFWPALVRRQAARLHLEVLDSSAYRRPNSVGSAMVRHLILTFCRFAILSLERFRLPTSIRAARCSRCNWECGSSSKAATHKLKLNPGAFSIEGAPDFLTRYMTRLRYERVTCSSCSYMKQPQKHFAILAFIRNENCT